MASIGISFFYEKEKIKILQDAAEKEDRKTSSYIQLVFNKHICKMEDANADEPKEVKSAPILKKKRVFIKRRSK